MRGGVVNEGFYCNTNMSFYLVNNVYTTLIKNNVKVKVTYTVFSALLIHTMYTNLYVILCIITHLKHFFRRRNVL